MNDDLEKQLRTNHPKTLENIDSIGCGDGWFTLLDDLCTKIDEECLRQGLTDRQLVQAVQIKEKFGGLRFYLSQATSEIGNLIHEAEDLSYKTCEVCGHPGEPRRSGWIKTLCDNCYAKRSQREI